MSVNVGTATGYLDLDISGFLTGLKSANSEATKEINNLSTSIGKGFETVGSKLTSAGKTLTTTITTPIVGLGTAAVGTAAKFESAMSQVQATMGITKDSTSNLKGEVVNTNDALSDLAQTMGKATKFSASEAADAINILAMAGYDTEKIYGTLPNVLNLAAAGGMGIADAADIATGVMAGFNYEAEKSAEVSDKIAMLASSAKGSVQEFGIGMSTAAGQARVTGQEFDDVAVALGILGNNNLAAAEGGNALNRILKNLYQPTDTAKTALEGLGISVYDVQGNAKALPEVLQNLQDKLAPLTKEEYNDVMSQIFDAATMKSAPFLIDGVTEAWNLQGNSADSLISKIQGASDAYDGIGAAAGQAETQMDNLSGQFTILKSALEGVAIQLGNIIMPHLKKFVDKIQELVDWFSNLSTEQQEQVVKFAAIAAAVGPVLLIFGKLITSIGSIITTFGKVPGAITKVKGAFPLLGTALTGITAPIAAIIAAVAALVAAFVTLWKTNEEFRDKMMGIWEEIKGKFEGFIQGVVDRVNELGFDFESIVEIVKAIWNGFCEFLAPAFESGFQALSNVLDVVFDVLLGLLDIFVGLFTGDWEQAWEGVKGIFVGLWDFLKDTLTNALDYLFKSSSTFLGLFETSWEELWDNVSTFFEETWKRISDFFENTWNGIVEFFTKKIPEFIAQAKEAGSGFLDKIVEFFTDLPYKIGFFIGESLAKVVKWAQEMEDKAKETAKNFLESIVKFFKELPGKVADHLTTSYKKAKEWSDNMRDKAIETGKNFLESIVSFFKELPGKLWNYFNESNDKAKQWVLDMGNRGLEAIRSLINNVVDGAMEIPQKMADIGRSIVTGVWDGISGAAKWLTDQVSSFFTGIVNGVRSGLGIGSPSKVFAEKVGKWLPAGVAVGFKSALPDAMKSMQTDLDKSTISLNTDFYAGVKRMSYSDNSLAFGQAKALMQSRQSASHSKNDIKIDINVNANVANDYDVRSLANELGVSVERELRSRGVATI